jgi:hypothetical protein
VKLITTLIPDIYQLLKGKEDGWFTDELSRKLSDDLSGRLVRQFTGNHTVRPTIRMSGLGPKCPRALWYSIHHPELAEPIPPWAQIKFAYGAILEGFVLSLCKAAGHEVTGEQDELRLDGIVGHRDAVIDGCVCDVKSASSISFQKFKSPTFEMVDSFGYLEQLDSYVVASHDDPLVRTKDRGYLIAIDKQLGHMHAYEHIARPAHIRQRIGFYKAIVGSPNPPPCECKTEEIGSSGNRKLDFKASYSPYKWTCFPHLRAFKYAGGIMYLSKVVKPPRNVNGPIPEIRRPKNTGSSTEQEAFLRDVVL